MMPAVERKTTWDGGKRVNQITGLGPWKITETCSVDREQLRLTVALQRENSRRPEERPMSRGYDAGSH